MCENLDECFARNALKLERVSEEACLKRVKKHQKSMENVHEMTSSYQFNKRAEECCRKSFRQIFDKRVQETFATTVWKKHSRSTSSRHVQ